MDGGGESTGLRGLIPVPADAAAVQYDRFWGKVLKDERKQVQRQQREGRAVHGLPLRRRGVLHALRHGGPFGLYK